MNWLTLASGAILGSCVLSASIIKARASRLLTKKQDSQVFGVRATRVAVRVFLMLYVSAVFIILAFLGVNVRLGTYVSYLVGAGLVVWAHVTYFRSLRALNLPAAYVSAIGRARMVMYLGFAAILGIVEMGRP